MTYGSLAPQHAALLKASAVTPEIAYRRGYRTVEEKSQLDRIGFSKNQQIVPGLLFPIYGVDAKVRTWQYRPDEPRLNNDGKPIKYETPIGSAPCIDIHPEVQPKLNDPEFPLWITEGTRKADAAAGRGLCCISLAGVWNWQRKTVRGASIPLDDWAGIPLKGRPVRIVFDSDVTSKRSVAGALKSLVRYLEGEGAKVVVLHLPCRPDGSKVGLDDYLAEHSVDDLLALAGPVEEESTVDQPATWVDSYRGLEFPIEAYPPILRQFITETSVSVCVHPDMLAVLMLPVLATAIGTSRVLGVKEDWVEAPRLWVAVVADPGGKKSPAQKRALAGLDLVQEELDAIFRTDLDRWESLDDKERKKETPPTLRQIIADDATIEALGRILLTHPRGVLMDKDELASWSKGFGEYKNGRGGDRQRWLSLWNGKTVRINRVGLGGAPLVVPHPFVSIVGGIQPEKVDSLLERGGDDGMIYRFLLSAPPSVEESARTPAVSEAIRSAWANICRTLYRLKGNPEGTARAVRVTAEGRERLLDELDRIYKEKSAQEMPASLKGFWGKADAHLLRLAAVLACTWAAAEGCPEEVDAATAERAALISDYFKGQALELFGAGGLVAPSEYTRVSPQMSRRVLEWMKAGHDKTTKRALMRGPLQHVSHKDVEELLRSMDAAGEVCVTELERGRMAVVLA